MVIDGQIVEQFLKKEAGAFTGRSHSLIFNGHGSNFGGPYSLQEIESASQQ